MLSTSNLSIQFGAKPLFEQVTVKFTDGNRYGLIGANGSGKSTLMKVLGGELEQSTGEVMLQVGLRMGKRTRISSPTRMNGCWTWSFRATSRCGRRCASAMPSTPMPMPPTNDCMCAAELEGRFAEYGGG